MISTDQLIVIVMGLVSAGALIVIERLGTSQHKALEAVLAGLADHTDRLLANYGERLLPIYEVSKLAESLIDEPTDFAVKQLPPDVIQAAQTIIDFAQRFTDGEPPQETTLEPASYHEPDPKGIGITGNVSSEKGGG